MSHPGRYFQLRDDMVSPGWHLSMLPLPDGSEPRLAAGLRFVGPAPLEAKVSVPGEVRDFRVTAFNVPVATRRLASAVSAVARADVQVIPLRVGEQVGACVLNSVRVIRCLDEPRSEFRKWTTDDHRADLAGQYKEVSRMKLDRTAIPSDAHFFRLDGWKVALIVSEEVKTAMEHAGCAGALFLDRNS